VVVNVSLLVIHTALPATVFHPYIDVFEPPYTVMQECCDGQAN